MKRRCFTLIELLVVIAIIALLTAISMSSLRRIRQQAKAVICGSNIKQLLTGLHSYENENETLPYAFGDMDHFADPPPDGYPGNAIYDRMGWWWFNFIEGFYRRSDRKNTVVQCPTKKLTDYRLNNDILCGNYGINMHICKSTSNRYEGQFDNTVIGTPLSSSNISNPSASLLIVDSGYSIITWWQACDNSPVTLGDLFIEETSYVPGLGINANRSFKTGQERDALKGRHPNKTVNVGFVDGHLSRVKAEDLLVENTAKDKYKNLSPLWIPKK